MAAAGAGPQAGPRQKLTPHRDQHEKLAGCRAENQPIVHIMHFRAARENCYIVAMDGAGRRSSVSQSGWSEAGLASVLKTRIQAFTTPLTWRRAFSTPRMVFPSASGPIADVHPGLGATSFTVSPATKWCF